MGITRVGKIRFRQVELSWAEPALKKIFEPLQPLVKGMTLRWCRFHQAGFGAANLEAEGRSRRGWKRRNENPC